ncbi:MAG: hypothetical protein A2277_00015 [Desulfobacterales bacterium RIFOXYA12_FULL_46_15]|nr:MAG: hypothetical protein A2097_14340 [Desulfobacula sp. GWF2_41_7]OGR23209.1 MAG: hypothetical protein A2277_00015 [Desulfobacterales bacterium RIFOXYA12_FULL_46_15]
MRRSEIENDQKRNGDVISTEPGYNPMNKRQALTSPRGTRTKDGSWPIATELNPFEKPDGSYNPLVVAIK